MTDRLNAITREEFEAHRRQVSKDIEGLLDVIKAESKERSNETSMVRADIKELAKSQGRPQYQALSFAFGVFSFVLAAIASVWMWGATNRWNATETTIGYQGEIAALNDKVQISQIVDIHDRLGNLEMKVNQYQLKNTADVSRIDATLIERQLEKTVYQPIEE